LAIKSSSFVEFQISLLSNRNTIRPREEEKFKKITFLKMLGKNLVFCFNALENRFFEVDAVHKVEHLYRKNFYRMSLRLNFYDGDINLSRVDEMRALCSRKITKLMTVQNMWQNHHSFYVVDYEIRTIARNQQNNNESDDEQQRNGEQEEERNENERSDDTFSKDSAYTKSPTPSGESGDQQNSSHSSEGSD
jgi:hypothetical protein